jgi:hypothetical protein
MVRKEKENDCKQAHNLNHQLAQNFQKR